jgi:NAD(P)-dependent dehydrogenase (short-subunit alcohol dehydrogenase family)
MGCRGGPAGARGRCRVKGRGVALALPAAPDLARFGNRVNIVVPGIFLSPLRAELPAEVQQGIGAGVPLPHRLSDRADVAGIVRMCLTNRSLNAEVKRLGGGLRLPPK